MVTIDVNTGRFVGKTNQEETILRANLQAAQEVARQIRLRDIGGLIIVDFIDMMHHSNRKRVYEEFKLAFARDRAKNSIATISEFGLIEMTRQRIRPQFMLAQTDPCPTCEGTGRVLSPETIAAKLERWFERARAATSIKRFRLIVHPRQAEHSVGRQGGLAQAPARSRASPTSPSKPTSSSARTSTALSQSMTAST